MIIELLMAKGVPTWCGIPFFYCGNTTIKPKEEKIMQKNTNKSAKTAEAAKPIGFRYSCGLNGSNTGLSHYILLDKKN
jgi:modified peptide precursor CbpA